MRKLSLILVFGMFIVGLACSSDDKGTNSNPPDETAEHHMVNIQNLAFSPADLAISVGDTVTWTNNDAAAHTSTATAGSTFNSGTLNQGESFTFVFNSAGTISYICNFHPATMSGSIVVQ